MKELDQGWLLSTAAQPPAQAAPAPKLSILSGPNSIDRKSTHHVVVIPSTTKPSGVGSKSLIPAADMERSLQALTKRWEQLVEKQDACCGSLCFPHQFPVPHTNHVARAGVKAPELPSQLMIRTQPSGGLQLAEPALMRRTFGAMLHSLCAFQQETMRANQAKQHFIRYIFHEVRVPFNSVVLCKCTS